MYLRRSCAAGEKASYLGAACVRSDGSEIELCCLIEAGARAASSVEDALAAINYA